MRRTAAALFLVLACVLPAVAVASWWGYGNATDTETFSIAILAPRPVTVTTQSAPAGTVGQAYWINLAADGGLPGYLWTLRSGTLPPGLDLTTRGALAGTPSARGTFTFTVGATDSRGTLGTRTFSVTVG